MDVSNKNTVCIKNYPLLKMPVKFHLSSKTFIYISWRTDNPLWVILYCSMPKQCLFLGPFELDKPWRHHNVLRHIFGSGQDVFLCVAFLLLWVWKITQDRNISPTWKPKGKVQPKVNILSPTHMSPATFFLPCNIKFEYRGCSFPYNEKNDSFVELQCKNLMDCFQNSLMPYNGFVYGKD